MKIAAFTGGQNVPSARFRVRQFIPSLAESGMMVSEFGQGGGGVYPPQQRWRKPFWGASRIGSLAVDVIRARKYDRTLLQREMVSSCLTLEPFTKSPRIYDVDDAIHLHRGGYFSQRIAEMSDRVIAGNAFLANWYSQWNRDVVILPTGVDTSRYVPRIGGGDDRVIIGWIGTASNHVYLDAIESALLVILMRNPTAHLRIISDKAPYFNTLPPERWSFKKWSEDDEIVDIQFFDIGIMPLLDTQIARGKCSFKMLQYMSCGIPVVASPVGMNADVLLEGNFGYSVNSKDDWLESITQLINNSDLRAILGFNGRKVINNKYSLNVLSPKLINYLM